MEHPAGESDDGSLRVDFDRRLRLEFHGSRITSDARLPAGDACLDANRRAGMFLAATLLKRSAVADNSTSRFTVAVRNVRTVACLPGGAAGPPIWEMSNKTIPIAGICGDAGQGLRLRRGWRHY